MSFATKPLKPKVVGLGDDRELFEFSYEIIKRIFHIPYEHYKQLYEETLHREEMAKSPMLRNFEYAVSYGFAGTFEEYKKKLESNSRGATGPIGPVGGCCGTGGGWSNVKATPDGTECIGARGIEKGYPGSVGATE